MASPWGPAEVDRLDQLAGNVPRSTLGRVYNCWAKRHGYPARTEKAIRLKITAMGLSIYPAGDWITTATIAETLHVCSFTARWWIIHLGLLASKDGPRWVVRRRDLRAFARKNPRLFARATRPALAQLLEDEVLADMITSGKHYYPHRPHPVRCIETGRVFPSMAAAAKASFVVRQVIRKAIRTGGTAAGYHWAWAE